MSSIIQKLKTEGVLKLYHDYRSRNVLDKSGNNNDGVMTNTEWTNNGIIFPSSTSLITVDNSSETQLTEGSLIVFGDLQDTPSGSDKRIISKRDGGGTNYELKLDSAPAILFYDGSADRSINTSVSGKKYLGVNFKSGEICEGFLNGISAGSFNDISTITTDDAPLIIGNFHAGTAPFGSITKTILIINRKLTASEHAQLYGELESMNFPTKKTSLEKNFRPDELTDGDMEASGVTAWTATGVTLSKVAGNYPNGSKQFLRVERTGATAVASQAIVVSGNSYRASGYAKSADGVSTPRIYSPSGTLVWGGSAGETDWQWFDFTFTVSGTGTFGLYGGTTIGHICDYNNIQIIDLGKSYSPKTFRTDWGVNESVDNVTSGYLENSPFTVQSGSFKISTDSINNIPKEKEELTDGDMEAVGVTDWNVSGITLTKESGTRTGGSGTQIAKASATATAYFYESVIPIGKTYRITGWARGDGSVYPRVYDGVVLWTGTISTDWQYFDVTFTSVASDSRLRLYTINGVGFTEWDDVSIHEVVNDVKVIECVTAGIISIPTSDFHQTETESAYGTWEWYACKAETTNMRLLILASVAAAHNDASQNGYYIHLNASEGYDMAETVAGSLSSKFASNGTIITVGTFHKIRVTRSSAGVFTAYLDDVLVSTSSGSNPFTDTTTTTNSYIVFSVEAGDKIAYSDIKGDHSIIKKVNVE